jgi:hypothetical protein
MKNILTYIFMVLSIHTYAQADLPPFNAPLGFKHQDNTATPSNWDDYIYNNGDYALQFWYATDIDMYLNAGDGTFTTKTKDGLIVNTGYIKSEKLYVYNVEDLNFSYHLSSKKNDKKFSDLSIWLLAQVRSINRK